MIRNIRHKGLAALYFDDQSKGLRQAHVRRLRQILALLDSAAIPEDMNAPGLRLHALKGDLAGHAGISPEMAMRLSLAFGRSPESWLQLQMQYDLAQARQRAEPLEVRSFVQLASG